MVHSSSWSKLLQFNSGEVPTTDYLSVLLALRPKSARLSLARMIQHEREDTLNAVEAFGIPKSIAEVLIAIHVEDPSFVTLPSIIDLAIDAAVKSKQGTAIRIETAEPLNVVAKEEIVAGLSGQFSEPMVVDASVNPSLIGGGRVHIGSLHIDISTKTQLTRLRQAVRS
jgi:F0F1-type ATP synthase delta subunit